MTSATLYREGFDLDELLTELDAEHPGRVRVVEVSYPREGGVFGFFARQKVGVTYELTFLSPADGAAADEVADAVAVAAADDDLDGHPLAALISAVEAAEARQVTDSPAAANPVTAMPQAAAPAPADAPAEPAPANLEFAQMLLDLAARKSGRPAAGPVASRATPADAAHTAAADAAGSAPAAPVALPQLPADQTPWIWSRPQPASQPASQPAPQGALPAQPAPQPSPVRERQPASAESRDRLALRRRLAEVGVPIDWVPEDGVDTYRVVEQLVNRLPAAPEPPTGAGDVVVIAGPAVPALRAAETLRARMRLRPENVWAAGCPAGSVPADRTVDDVWQAATVAAEVRLGGRGPTIVVVATDDDDTDELGHERWAADVVRALAPEALWAVVDATRKPSDTRARLRALGSPTALVVTAAARTASPASVWELDVPTALIDGRPATRGGWAVLLIDKLAELES